MMRASRAMTQSRSLQLVPPWRSAVLFALVSAVTTVSTGLAQEVSASPHLTLAFTGDISFAGRDAITTSTLPEARDPLRFLRSTLAGADFTVANLECILAQQDFGRVPGHPALWAPPTWAQSLARAGIDLIGVANNHSYDGGGQGLLESISILHREGLRTFGGGPDDETARAFHRYETPNGCIAIVPATTFVNQSTPEGPGRAAHYPRRIEFYEQIREARETCSFVVAYLHGGPQFVDMPTRAQRVVAHRAVEAGAHLVVAHHPHVLQGVEYYRGSAIAYSLGNLVFNNPRPMTFPTGVLVATLTRSAHPQLIALDLIPAYIDRDTYTPHPAGTRSHRMRRQLASISRPFGTRVELTDGRIRFLAP